MPRPKHLVTPHFGFEYPELGAEANVPEDVHQLALEIENVIHNLAVSELGTAGAGDAKKLLVVQNTGAAAWKALSGDATISEAGAILIAAEAIVASKLAALAVEEAKIAGEAVATAKIKALAITAAKLGAEAVETGKVKLLAITEALLAGEAVGTSKIANLAITEAKLGNLSVGTGKIAELAVTAIKLANEAVETGKIKNLAVTAAKLGEEAVETAKIKNLAITTAKIAEAAVTDEKLASPNNVVFKLLHHGFAHMDQAQAAGTYLLDGAAGSAVLNNAESTVSRFHFDLLAANLAVANKTTKLRLRVSTATNATAPGVTFSFGFYPITSIGGAANTFKQGSGAVVAESVVVIMTPGASAVTTASGADFALPADGPFVIGVATNSALAANAFVQLSAQLLVHHV